MVKVEVGPMASAIHSEVFGPCGARTAPVRSGVGAKLMTLARRLNRALGAERPGEVDRKIARILAQSGGPLTDSLEREIMRKVFASDWSLPQ
jgi:capsular polysaccharide biosynthesis protein